MRVTFSLPGQTPPARPQWIAPPAPGDRPPEETSSASGQTGWRGAGFTPAFLVSLTIAVFALVATAGGILLIRQDRLVDDMRLGRAEQQAQADELNRTRFACATLAVTLGAQAAALPSAERDAVLAELRPVIALCSDRGQPVERQLLRNARRIAMASNREAARTARRVAAALAPNDVDYIVDTSGGQLANVADLVEIAAYGGGPVMDGAGRLNFRRHVDDPGENELRKVLAHEAAHATF